MSNILLHTKTHIPPLRPDRVARPRLQHMLDQGQARGCKLSLVCAPAGFGKTTLVTEWLAAQKEALIGWLSLDEGDNHLILFLHYLDAALRKIAPFLPEAAWETVEGELSAEHFLTRVINDLAECVTASSVLVLDDYHCLTNPEIHAAVSFFLENKPTLVHAIIITRRDPLLPLSRWRARGQVNEIRMNNLRFTLDEAAGLLNEHLKLDLSPEGLSALESRTEGWIAGIQLAAITIQQEKESGSPEEFVQAFAGDNRYIMDYLTDEVLLRQPQTIRSFLLSTSILERMCSPLCEALWTPSGEDSTSAVAVLDTLDRANLFLIPLDHERFWYRYHHLFAQLLRQRLIHEQGESAAADLHRKAAAWFASQGLVHEAVTHAAAVKDYAWLASFIEKTLEQPAAWSRGEVNRMLGWLNQLPETVIEARPQLCMHVARTLHIAGDTRAGITWLQKAETGFKALPDSPEKAYLLSMAAVNWATFYVMLGETPQAFQAVEEALRLLPPQETLWRARALHSLALAYDEVGDLHKVREIYEQVADLARRSGNLLLALSTLGSLSATLNRLGDLRQAETCCRQALAQLEGSRARTPAASMLLMALAAILYEQNQLDHVEYNIEQAIDLAKKGGLGLTLTHSNYQVMRFWIRMDLGDRAGAQEILEQIDASLSFSHQQWERRRLNQQSNRARLALAIGDLPRASAWARDYERMGATQFHREEIDLDLARIYLAEGQAEKAIRLLNRLLVSSQQNGRGHQELEIRILLAKACAQLDQHNEARAHLQHAVEMAAPQGYVRPFIGEGEAIQTLLREIGKPGLPFPVLDFINLLLGSFPSPQPAQSKASVHQPLIDPLTERELEVLHYLAEGQTIADIAHKLYLSPNTLKAHTNTIYSKLDVHSRLQAVNKACELGLLADTD
jgi:LuxR family transcriptional regulator, maltose regulon positive regulatory protein